MGQDPAQPQRGLFVEVPGEGDRSSPRRGQDGPPRCGAGAEGRPPASPTACLYLWTSGRSPPPTLCPLRAPSPRRLTPQCWWWRRSWLTTGRSGRAGSPAGTGGSCRRGRWRSSAAPAWWLRGTGQAHVRPAASPESGLPGPPAPPALAHSSGGKTATAPPLGLARRGSRTQRFLALSLPSNEPRNKVKPEKPGLSGAPAGLSEDPPAPPAPPKLSECRLWPTLPRARQELITTTQGVTGLR